MQGSVQEELSPLSPKANSAPMARPWPLKTGARSALCGAESGHPVERAEGQVTRPRPHGPPACMDSQLGVNPRDRASV